MAVQNPPAFLQNAGATHTAQVTRAVMAGISATPRVASSLTPRGGVHPGNGNVLVVTQQGSPTMGITVDTGTAYIPGSEATGQGAYAVVNATATNVAVTAAHASLGRIDLVVFRVYDTQYSGALNQCALEVIAGTPAASPAAPAAPNNSLVLAQIAVGAAVTSIVNANITDKRAYIPTGVTSVETFTDLSLLIPFIGTMGYVRNEETLYTYNGSSWIRGYRYNLPILSVSTSASAAIGTTETVFQSTATVTYKANTAYKVTLELGYVLSTASAFPLFLVRKVNTAGALVVDFATRPINAATGVVIGAEMSRVFIVGGSDVTTSLVASTATVTGGTVTISAASARPRVFKIEEWGAASNYPTHPLLS